MSVGHVGGAGAAGFEPLEPVRPDEQEEAAGATDEGAGDAETACRFPRPEPPRRFGDILGLPVGGPPGLPGVATGSRSGISRVFSSEKVISIRSFSAKPLTTSAHSVLAVPIWTSWKPTP